MVKSWQDFIGHEIEAHIDEKGSKSSVNLSKPKSDNTLESAVLSPITTFVLNIWAGCINENKNLILNFPNNMVKTIPLICYISSFLTSKSTLIFTSGKINFKNEIMGKHNRHYQLLSWAGSDYLYTDIPIGVIKENSLYHYLYLPHATNKYRREHRSKIEDDFLSSNNRILLNGAENSTKITKAVNNIFIDNKEVFNYKSDLNIGCIIFENADRYFNSERKTESFINWLNDIPRDVLILIHFSNSNLKFIPKLKEGTNSLVVPFNNNILRNNTVLSKHSLNYFEDKSYSKILENYNLDTKINYNFNHDITMVNSLYCGNIDYFIRNSSNLIRDIDMNSLKNKSYFYHLKNLFYSLKDLAINPSFYRFKIKIQDSWRYINVPFFIELFESRLDEETNLNQILLSKLIINLNSVYLELSRCKRYGEEESYERIGKSYKILEIAFNKKEFFGNDSKLIIGTYQSTEPKILNETLIDVEDVEAIYLRSLLHKDKDFSEYNLLLPGIVPPDYFSILKKQFNKVLILAYDGVNANLINDQINLVLNPSFEYEKKAMEYFSEIYDFIGETKNDAFFNDFNKRLVEYKKHAFEEVNKEDFKEKEESNNEFSTIKSLFDFPINYNSYTKGRKFTEDNLNNENLSNYSNETISVNLFNLVNEQVYTKNLIKNKKYLRFKSYDELDKALEVKPQLLNKDDYVIVMNNNMSFLDIFMSIFDQEEFIDRELVNYWRDLLIDYKNSNNLSIKEVYKIYEDFTEKDKTKHGVGSGPIGYQAFRQWIRGYIIAPSNVDDLKRLALMFDDVFLLKHSEEILKEAEKLRNLNRFMGRKLNFIIRTIIENSGEIDYNNLSFEEQDIFNIIKHSVYQVVSVNN